MFKDDLGVGFQLLLDRLFDIFLTVLFIGEEFARFDEYLFVDCYYNYSNLGSTGGDIDGSWERPSER
jgi:hypothetical protein